MADNVTDDALRASSCAEMSLSCPLLKSRHISFCSLSMFDEQAVFHHKNPIVSQEHVYVLKAPETQLSSLAAVHITLWTTTIMTPQ